MVTKEDEEKGLVGPREEFGFKHSLDGYLFSI